MRPAAARTAPPAARNREPILAVLRQHLPRPARLLEIASGSGEHALWFSQALPDVSWRPTDRDADALASIAAWRDEAGPPNLLEPMALDVTDAAAWPADRFDAVLAVNMIHIAPWRAAEGLTAGAAAVLDPGGLLILYGPFMEGGRHTAPSNAAFDDSLRARDPAWGVRDLDAVAALAEAAGFDLAARIAMPANNLSLVFHRR